MTRRNISTIKLLKNQAKKTPKENRKEPKLGLKSGHVGLRLKPSKLNAISNMEVVEEAPKASPAPQITHRMFVLEWIGMDLIRKHFVNGEKAVYSAAKILRKQFHISEYTEPLEIERFVKSVSNDAKANSAFHNYVTQTWRGQKKPITNKEVVEELVKNLNH